MSINDPIYQISKHNFWLICVQTKGQLEWTPLALPLGIESETF